VVKLKRLKINSFRNVRPGSDLRFSDRFNILLGPNGAGKTTLLNFISHVLRSGVPEPGDPFSIELEVSVPGGTLTGTLSAASEPDPSATLAALGLGQAAISAVRSDRPSPPVVDFRVELQEPQQITTVRTDQFELLTTTSTGEESGFPIDMFTTDLLGGVLSLILFAGVKERGLGLRYPLRNAFRFDESLDAFRALIGRAGTPMPLESEVLRPQINAIVNLTGKGDYAVVPKGGIVPNDLIQALDHHVRRNVVDISIEHTKLTFLTETVRLLNLRSVEMKLELTEKTVNPGGPEFLSFGNLKFWFTRHDGSVFLDHQLSYGQKRLFAFLYYLDANPSIVIADELVNGLHHAWIEECIKAIGDRQAFLTSQNPLLLDHLWFESIEQVKETFIVCRTEVVGDREQMIWRNLTDDEADMFYSAYRVGIEHVGEILRTRGLW
jgi:energy-coupling factor transporter ATP-binding protein EcfA2